MIMRNDKGRNVLVYTGTDSIYVTNKGKIVKLSDDQIEYEITGMNIFLEGFDADTEPDSKR